MMPQIVYFDIFTCFQFHFLKAKGYVCWDFYSAAFIQRVLSGLSQWKIAEFIGVKSEQGNILIFGDIIILIQYELELIKEPAKNCLIFTSGIDELVIQLKLEYFDWICTERCLIASQNLLNKI